MLYAVIARWGGADAYRRGHSDVDESNMGSEDQGIRHGQNGPNGI